MAELKSTIKIELDGIHQYLIDVKAIDKEIANIEQAFRKLGKSEEEAAKLAKDYRNKQIALVKAQIEQQHKLERAEQDAINKRKQGLKEIGKIAAGITIGGTIEEIFGRAIAGLSDLVEKNKDADKSIGNLDKAFNKLKGGAAQLGLSFLRNISKPVVAAANLIGKFSEKVFGISFETEAASKSLSKLQVAFNSEIEVLKQANLSQEARVRLINQINEKYKDYLPNLLTEKSSIEDITAAQEAGNSAFERKILILATQEKAVELTRKIVDLQIREIETRLQLNEQIAAEEEALKNVQSTVKDGINVNLQNARTRQGYARQALKDIDKESKALKDQLNIVKGFSESANIDISAALKVDEKKSDAPFKTKPASVKVDTFLDVSSTINQDFEGFLTPGEEDFIKAGKEIDKLKQQIDNFKKDIEGSVKAEGSLGTLGSKLLGLEVDQKEIKDRLTGSKGNIITKVFDILKRDIGKEVVDFKEELDVRLLDGVILSKDVLDTVTEQGNALFKAFLTPDLNEEEANAIFKRVFDSSKTFVENLKALAAEGITSPIFENLIINQDAIDKVKSEIAIAKEEVEKFGKDRVKQLEDMEKDLADKQAKFDEAKTQSTINTNKALYELIKERNKQSLEQGVLLEEDLLEEYSRRQKFELNAIDTSIEAQIKANKLAGDEVSEAQLQALGELQLQRTTLIKTHLKELESLGEDLTKMLFSQFQIDFSSTADELQTGLDTLNLKIRTATRVLDETFTKFGDKRSEKGEELSKNEIDIINDQIDTIQALELQRYEQELALRVNAFKDFLNQLDLESDVKIKLINDFYNEEVKLAEDNVDKLNAVNARRPDTPDKIKKTHTEILNAINVVQQAFSDIFSAYVTLQDAIAQKAIDNIQTQLDTLNDQISETVSNIDSLESDLEGKRSGRREAILRGLAIEKAREEELTNKKIDLERKLRAAEKKASDERKAAAIGQALINGAIAITNVWANSTIPYPAQAVFGAIQTAALATITGLQIATIEQQTFADGGMLDGPSHKQGGIPFTINGTPGFEAEGGEAIMSRRTVEMFKPQLHAMQVASGSKGLYAEGGMLGANFGAMTEALSGSSFRQLQMIAQKDSYVKVSDIDNLQARQARVTDITTL